MENEIDLPSHASSPDEPGDRFRLVRDYIVLFLYFVVAILAIFGNLFVVWVIRKREKLRKSKTFLILTNMAISGKLPAGNPFWLLDGNVFKFRQGLGTFESFRTNHFNSSNSLPRYSWWPRDFAAIHLL